MNPESIAAVGVRGLTKRFDGRARRGQPTESVVAVDGLDLDVGDGEFFAMLGPSGCGKTTMLRMIAGLEFPTAGTIEIFGEPVADVPANRRPVNTVFQQYALFPHMTVADNVGFGLRMQKVAKNDQLRRVGEALDLVQMGGLDGRMPAELSGGQQQRVALARALVNRPRVLLLDEPLGALDHKLRVEMQGELQSLQRELGITFVFVTHDQEEALTMSDRIAVMRDGRILQLGTANDVYERPADRFVADFIGQINLLEGTVADGSTVVLATGARVAADVRGRPAGSSVAVAIRPERLHLVADGGSPTGPGQTVDGVIDAVTYLGNASIVTVRVEWTELTVRVPAGVEVPGVGSSVMLHWDPDALIVLGDDQPEGGGTADG